MPNTRIIISAKSHHPQDHFVTPPPPTRNSTLSIYLSEVADFVKKIPVENAQYTRVIRQNMRSKNTTSFQIMHSKSAVFKSKTMNTVLCQKLRGAEAAEVTLCRFTAAKNGSVSSCRVWKQSSVWPENGLQQQERVSGDLGLKVRRSLFFCPILVRKEANF